MSNRVLKSSICDSETIQALHEPEIDFGAEVLFTRIMVSCCDDYGRFDARPSMIRSKCWPLMPERISLKWIEAWLTKMCRMVKPNEPGLISIYDAVDEKGTMRHCGVMNKWSNHQRVRNSKSKLPEPPVNNLLPNDGELPRPAAGGGELPPDTGHRTPDSGHQTLDTGICAPTSSDAPSAKDQTPVSHIPTFAQECVDRALKSYAARYCTTRNVTEYPGGQSKLNKAYGCVLNALVGFCNVFPKTKDAVASETPEQLKAIAKKVQTEWVGYLDRAVTIDKLARDIPGKGGQFSRFPDTVAKFCGRLTQLTAEDVKEASRHKSDVAEARANSRRMGAPEPAPAVRLGELERFG